MGSSLETYVGAYIKIKRIKVKKPFTYPGCNNKSCTEYKKEAFNSIQFCPNCGSKIEILSENREADMKDWWDIMEDNRSLNDTFSDISDTMYTSASKRYIFLIPNANKYTPKNWHFDKSGDCEQLFDLHPAFINKDIEDLKTLAKKIIDILQKECGEENVSVHWGVLQYYS